MTTGNATHGSMTELESYEVLTVPVDGGDLTVLRWAATVPDAPVVLAAHGITANGLVWGRVVHELAGRATVIAPDLRGRAGSSGLPGPWGINRHAEDLVAVADALCGERPVLTGHSMGAFVAALAASKHQDRFGGLLLVDGGVGFPVPDLPPDQLIAAVIGPAMTRLTMTFPDRESYMSFWKQHPAYVSTWSDWSEAYLQRDVVGTEPELRSSCVVDAIRTDGLGQAEDGVLEAVRRLRCPARLLYAERGVLDQPQGLYDEELLAAAKIPDGMLDARRVPDTNHFSLLVGDRGAALIARGLLQLAGGDAAA